MSANIPWLLLQTLTLLSSTIFTPSSWWFQSDFIGNPKIAFGTQWHPNDSPPLSSVVFAQDNQGKTMQSQLANADPTTTRLVFTSFRSGNWEIYSADGLANNVVRLTNQPAADIDPQLSFNGATIVFASKRDGDYEIYRMNADGSGLVKLTSNSAADAEPAWSSDGRSIVFVSDRDGNAELYMMNADGSAQTRLTNDPADDFGPTWSLTGQLAWIRSIDGQGNRMLLTSPPTPFVGTTCRFMDRIIWSPDGSQMAYGCDRDGDFWNEVSTTSGATFDAAKDFVDMRPVAWAPDGGQILMERIVYVVQGNTLVFDKRYLETFGLTNSQVQRLPNQTGKDSSADWRWVDSEPPVVQVRKLPALSHCQGLSDYGQCSVPITYTIVDQGPAGFPATQMVEYQIGATNVWSTTTFDSSQPYVFLGGKPGDSIRVRLRARDFAGNTSVDDVDHVLATRFYHYRATGQIVDWVGTPLSNVTVDFETNGGVEAQTQTTLKGQFEAYLFDPAEHTLTLAKPGYATKRFIVPDAGNSENVTIKEFLLPKSDLVVNGDFTDGTSGWEFDSNYVSRVPFGYKGNSAIAFKTTGCQHLCFEYFAESLWGLANYYEMAVDSQNITYLLWPSGSTLQLSTFVSETWSAPEVIQTALGRDTLPIQIIIDATDTVHILWLEGFVFGAPGHFWYSARSPSGQWSTPTDLGMIYKARMAIDPHTRHPFILYGCIDCYGQSENSVYYRESVAPGQWQSPVKVGEVAINNPFATTTTQVAIGKDGTKHFAWYGPNLKLLYRRLLPDGNLQPIQVLTSTDYFHFATIVDDENTLQFALPSRAGIRFAQVSPSGEWSVSPDIAIPRATDIDDAVRPQLKLASNGTMYLFFDNEYGSSFQGLTGFLVARKEKGKPWSGPEMVRSTYGPLGASAVDANGDLRIILPDAFLRLSHAPPSLPSIIQTLQIPDDTLSYVLSLRMAASSQFKADPDLMVRVSTSTTTVVLDTQTAITDWRNVAVDLTPWAGQAITVSFALSTNVQGMLSPQLYIDEIHAGRWETPIIQTLSITELPSYAAQTAITITGLNFAPTPTLRLGETALTDIHWVNTHTLEATIPASLPVGVYDLWITNPGGQENVLSGAIKIGQHIYMPVVAQLSFESPTPV